MTNGKIKNHLLCGLIHPILAQIQSFLQECLIMQRARLRSPFWQVPAVWYETQSSGSTLLTAVSKATLHAVLLWKVCVKKLSSFLL